MAIVSFDGVHRVIDDWKRQKPRLIVLTGCRKTGKDKLYQYLLKNYHGVVGYRIADAIIKIADILEIEPERRVQHALFGVNAVLRPIIGTSAYMRKVLRVLEREKPRLALIHAVRTVEEYREFVERRGGVLIGITADPLVRYRRAVADARVQSEKRDEGRMTYQEFLGNHRQKTGEFHPTERRVSALVARAHFIIENNNHTPHHFYRDIDAIMGELGLRKKKR